MSGHVFIVRGDLRKLACDAWLMPCSRNARPQGIWFLPGHQGPWHGPEFADYGPRVQPFPGWPARQPQAWLGRVGGAKRDVAWYVGGGVEFIHKAADALKAQTPLFQRCLPLVALPLVGTGQGLASRSGEVVQALLPELRTFVGQRDVDVALVCFDSSTYAAAQAERARAEAEGKQYWPPELDAALRKQADHLAWRAGKNELALILGAGVSQAAGLPDWKGLLQALGQRAKMTEDECRALAGINTLDQASILKRRLGDAELALGIKAILGSARHYSLTHALLAALPVREVVTTNYDQLFEEAWRHPSGDDIMILPNRTHAGQTRQCCGKNSPS